MNILIAEDDEKVAQFLKENLGQESYQVTIVPTMSELEKFLVARPSNPSLVILDRLLGNDDTKNIIKRVKDGFPEASILFLSALNTPAEKAKLLDEGADDYVGKPFSLVELQARVRALLRRNAKSESRAQGLYINVGDIIVDLKTRGVICQGNKIELTPKEFSLLVNFCENPGRVYSKYQLLDLIWETNLDVESNVIEVNIMNMRRKLDAAKSKVMIQSKRNIGYWLEA